MPGAKTDGDGLPLLQGIWVFQRIFFLPEVYFPLDSLPSTREKNSYSKMRDF
jgi:hypothetical protein